MRTLLSISILLLTFFSAFSQKRIIYKHLPTMPKLAKFHDLPQKEAFAKSRELYVDGIKQYVQQQVNKLPMEVAQITFQLVVEIDGQLTLSSFPKKDSIQYKLVQAAVDSLNEDYSWLPGKARSEHAPVGISRCIFIERSEEIPLSQIGQISCQKNEQDQKYTLTTDHVFNFLEKFKVLKVNHCPSNVKEVIIDLGDQEFKILNMSDQDLDYISADLIEATTFTIEVVRENGKIQRGIIRRILE